MDTTASTKTFGALIEPITDAARELLALKQAEGRASRFSKAEKDAITTKLLDCERLKQLRGVDFSRAQIDAIMKSRDRGDAIEFETLGPYLADYLEWGGVMTRENLIPEDAVGLELAATFRAILPNARLVSLYDEYNMDKGDDLRHQKVSQATPEVVAHFKRSLLTLFEVSGAISAGATESNEVLLIAESHKVIEAEKLVARLEEQRLVYRNGQEIAFFNENAENPLYQRIVLKTKEGKWLCEALDAAAYLKPDNLHITHIVVLPEYMKAQQDKVWELLRILGVKPEKYHNIFFDPKQDPHSTCGVIRSLFLEGDDIARDM